MTRVLRNLLIAVVALFGGGVALAQPTMTITNVKDACAGNNNGSFDVNILTANGPVTLLIFGPPNFSRSTAAGLTETFTGLKPQDYFVVAQDIDGSKLLLQSISNVTTQISLGSASVSSNTSCSAPNGSINITPTGGTGAPYIYAWSGPGSFTSTAQNLSGLTAGSYTVTVTNPTNNCQFISSPIVITDPSPLDQPFTTPSPESLCAGNPATVTLGSTQVLTLPLSYYELLKNGVTTGVKASGTGGPLTLTLPSGFVNGDVLTVRAVDDLCTPKILSGSVTLNVHTPPSTATLSGTNSICLGTSTNLSVVFAGGTGPFSITITDGTTPFTVSPYTSGNPIPVSPIINTTYTLTAASDINCPASALAGSAVITVKPAPTSAVISGSPVICAGSGPANIAVTITGGTSPYQFTLNDGFGLRTGYVSGTPIAENPGATTVYTIVGNVTDATGCFVAGSGSATVTVNIPPSSATLSLSPSGASTICAGSNAVLRVTIVGGTSPYSFTIPGVPPQVGYVSGTDISFPLSTTTTFNMAGVVVTDTKLCTVLGSGSVPITVNPVPIATIAASPGVLCAGAGSSTLTFTLTGTAPFTVQYNDGVNPTFTLPGISSGHTVLVSPLATTTYTITSVTDATTCVGVGGSAATVTVNTPPTSATLSLSASGSSAICPGGNAILKVNIVGGTGPYSFTIPGVPAQVAYVSGTDISFPLAATTTFDMTGVIVTDFKGCTVVGTGSVPITVNPVPVATIAASPGVLCAGAGSSTLTFTLTGTAPFTVQYNDGINPTFTLPGISSGHTVLVSPLATTTYTITSVTDATTCVGVGGSAATVTVNTPPTSATLSLSASGSSSICPGGNAILKVDIIGGTGPYSFTIPGVPAQAAYVSGTDISFPLAATTTFDMTGVIVTDFKGCTVVGTGSVPITVNPVPVATLAASPGVLCAGSGNSTLTFTLTGTGPFTVQYNDGVNPFTLPGISSGHTVLVSPLATTTYTITSVTDATTCSGLGGSAATVTVNTPATSATLGLSAAGTSSVCPGGNAVLKVDIIGGTGPYSFTIPGVPAQSAYASGTDIIFPLVATTTFDMTGVIVTDSKGCTVVGTGAVPITLNVPPSNAVISVSGATSVCAGVGSTLAVTITGGVSPYTVTIDNGVPTVTGYVSGTAIPVSPAATTTYSVTSVKDANGCDALALSGSALITVIPLSTAVLSGDNTICVGSPTTLSIALTGTQPWSIVYTDGSSNFPVSGITSSPYTFPVSPIFSTNYSLVSVADATCPPGTVSGTASITVNAIGGNPAVSGTNTWLGYVYDDSGDLATPLPGRINFANTKYRGVIDATDIATMSPFSSYNSTTNEFDLNISNNASGNTIHSPNVCGTYKDHFSIRYRMTQTFTKGVYTFTVGSDDGVRLFLDGVSIIPGAFTNHTYATFTTAAQCISAGPHDLVIEYYENTSFSRLTFNYQAAAAPTVTSPVSVCIGSASPTLTASSTDPAVIGFNWYKDSGLVTLLSSGATFVPGPADLNTGTLGTTSFFVTALYACGETIAAQQDVTIINSATITPPTAPFQVCQTGGTIDLTSVVAAVPTGGTFTFTGTGITTSPIFDPTLVTGTSTISVSYTSGTCSTSTTFNIDVVTAAAVSVPATPVDICQATAPIDMTTLVTATPTGGTFTFTGAGVTGNLFDPSAQSGAVPITVDYNAGGCTDTKTLTFNVVPIATLTITNPPATCPTAGLINLTTLVSAVPTGGVFTFSGPGVTGNNFDPSTQAGTTAVITVGYNIGGCTASGTISISVNASCGSNCGAFTVLITDSRPTCVSQIDGVININVTGGTPNYVVTLSDGGSFNQALAGPGPLFTYSNLSPADYFYTIADNAGNTCTLPHSLPVQTSVQAVASNFVNALCFNQPVGGATVTVTSGGTAPYEYSIDGGSTWVNFTSPVVITNLMPLGSYSILVRDDATDPCAAQVPVTIDNAVGDIVYTGNITSATCADNDGTLEITAVTGGTSPYTYQLDGVPYATLPPGNIFTGLIGGSHIFTVIDANNCNKDFPFIVNFPGLVLFSTSSVAPDCTGNGSNGSLTVTITSVGSFKVGISTDPSVPPTVFQDVVSAGSGVATFTNLTVGTYYVTAQALGAQCPTVSATSIAGGPVAVSFTTKPADMVCFSDPGGVILSSVVGAPTIDYQYQIIETGNVVQSGTVTALQALGDVALMGLSNGTYEIQLSQDQSAASGCASPIVSGFVSFTVTGPLAPLDTLYVNKTVSFPDLPSGSMLVGVAESGAEPYEIKLELTTPLIPSQGPYVLDWTEMSRNPQNLKVEYRAKNLFAGEYLLSLRDTLGCIKTYTVDLGVDTNISIPNIFTPNDDGINDVFYIRNLPAATVVIVTNRWGKEVFRTGDYQNDWNGGSIDDGVYYYKVSAAGQTFNGWVEIQRAQGQPH